MMRIGIIADVHANLPALSSVLAELASLQVDRIVCLGDIVGYNASPSECLELVLETCDVVVAGNHDRDVADPQAPLGTNAAAQVVMSWTREVLSPGERAQLAALPSLAVLDCCVAVHGCYLNSIYYQGYVTSTMLEANLEAVAAESTWPKLALCGHTHVPLCGYLDDAGLTEAKTSLSWPANARAVLVNPGSVGQPRDRDPRASFAVVDTNAMTSRVLRVDYPVQSAVDTIHRRGLPKALADRLLEGR